MSDRPNGLDASWDFVENASLVSGSGYVIESGSGWYKEDHLLEYYEDADNTGWYLYSPFDCETGKRDESSKWHCYAGPYATVEESLDAIRRFSNPFTGLFS